jgi:hypothetical protein
VKRELTGALGTLDPTEGVALISRAVRGCYQDPQRARGAP